MRRWLPQSLFGRLLLFLTGGLVLAQLFSAAILLQDRDQSLYHAIGGHLAQRIAAIVNLLDRLEPDERQRLAQTLDLPPTRLSLAAPWQGITPDERYHTTLFRALLRRQLGPERVFQVEINDDLPPPPPRTERPRWLQADTDPSDREPPRWRHAETRPRSESSPGFEQRRGRWRRHAELLGLRNFVVQVQLRDGAIVTFQQVLPEDVIAWPVRALLILLVLLVSVALLVFWAVRVLTRPLAVLADAATALGRDMQRAPLPETGPLEIRRAATAFNHMQERLIRYVEDRNRVLAAVSHDLKTPITRLRLRAELLDDPVLRDKVLADLEEMQQMAQASLDFLRSGADQAPVTVLDLDALLESLQEDAEDAGQRIELIGGPIRQPLRGRPLALKRCLTNLVDNALQYGQQATITVTETPTRVTLAIRDHGSGIAEAELERVFAPFYRLEGSRNRHTGGTGLGLSIARNIARAHGGELRLRNHPHGGLEAVLELPH